MAIWPDDLVSSSSANSSGYRLIELSLGTSLLIFW